MVSFVRSYYHFLSTPFKNVGIGSNLQEFQHDAGHWLKNWLRFSIAWLSLRIDFSAVQAESLCVPCHSHSTKETHAHAHHEKTKQATFYFSSSSSSTSSSILISRPSGSFFQVGRPAAVPGSYHQTQLNSNQGKSPPSSFTHTAKFCRRSYIEAETYID